MTIKKQKKVTEKKVLSDTQEQVLFVNDKITVSRDPLQYIIKFANGRAPWYCTSLESLIDNITKYLVTSEQIKLKQLFIDVKNLEAQALAIASALKQ